jgi:hypothetical protein
MMKPVPRLARILPLLLALGAAACADKLEVVEQTTQGPTAWDVLAARSLLLNGREPSFDEKRHWDNEVEARIAKYLREHPELEQSPRYTEFRFWRQVAPGATRSEVETLLEEPQERTIDPALMAVLAERHWMELERKAGEAWVYYAWVIYFDDAAVVGIVRRVSGLEPRYD